MGKKKREIVLGIDIGKSKLAVAMRGLDANVRDLDFENDASGHHKLVAVCTKGQRQARVCLEATGPYWLDLALALVKADVQVMVVNPKAARRFAEACMGRAKTDRVDARALLDFAERMPFVPWTAPAEARLALRMYSRQIAALTREHTACQNRLIAAKASVHTPVDVLDDIELGLVQLEARIASLLARAIEHVRADAELSEIFEVVTSLRGIAEKSAILLMGELLVLPTEMSAAQWVAYAGLDPRPFQSGSSIDKRPRISRVGSSYLRHILFMPALVAARWEPAVNAYYERLIARGKKRMIALVAVMRKVLHALWGMIRHKSKFDGARFDAKFAAAT